MLLIGFLVIDWLLIGYVTVSRIPPGLGSRIERASDRLRNKANLSREWTLRPVKRMPKWLWAGRRGGPEASQSH